MILVNYFVRISSLNVEIINLNAGFVVDVIVGTIVFLSNLFFKSNNLVKIYSLKWTPILKAYAISSDE